MNWGGNERIKTVKCSETKKDLDEFQEVGTSRNLLPLYRWESHVSSGWDSVTPGSTGEHGSFVGVRSCSDPSTSEPRVKPSPLRVQTLTHPSPPPQVTVAVSPSPLREHPHTFSSWKETPLVKALYIDPSDGSGDRDHQIGDFLRLLSLSSSVTCRGNQDGGGVGGGHRSDPPSTRR